MKICDSNENCRNIDKCNDKIEITTWKEQSQGISRFIKGRLGCDMDKSESRKYEKELCEAYNHKQMAHVLAGMEQTLKDTQKLADEYFAKCEELEAENERLRKTNDALNDILETKAGSWNEHGFSFKDICDMQDRHQADCITINHLNVTIDTLVDKLARLRELRQESR